MKKNIKFVGAAAAALLAVAPVVASTTVANAAVTVNNATATQTTQATAGTVTVNASLNATAGKTSVTEAENTISISATGASIANKKGTAKDDYSVKIVKANGDAVTGNLEANQAYKIVVTGIKFKGLTTGNNYAIAGGTITGNKTTADASVLNQGVDFTTDAFYVFDKALTGNPYVVEGAATAGTVRNSGSVSLAEKPTVASLATVITNKYSVASETTGTAEGLDFSQSAVEDAIRAGLKAANVTVEADGSFKAPATSFTVNLTAYASNGNSVNFPVTVVVKDAPVVDNAPVITNAQSKAGTYSKITATSANLAVNPGALISANTIAGDFTATINKGSSTKTSVTVDSSNLNTNVAGKYTVVLKATNPSGKTTKFTVNVTVGNPGETKTVQAGSETAKVVTIDGNTVTDTNNTLANGASVATYGTVSVKGVSYTRLNSENSNQFVETKYVDGSIKEEKKSEKTIMHVAIVYNAKGEKTSEKIGAYNKVTVLGDIVTINGAKYYKLGQDRFVKAGNIDGTSRKLTHNAYIYNNKAKRVQKHVVLKKGTEKTTYGSSFKINGKAYYRIGKNQYVKVANFR